MASSQFNIRETIIKPFTMPSNASQTAVGGSLTLGVFYGVSDCVCIGLCAYAFSQIRTINFFQQIALTNEGGLTGVNLSSAIGSQYDGAPAWAIFIKL